jgi:hypothetical protein
LAAEIDGFLFVVYLGGQKRFVTATKFVDVSIKHNQWKCMWESYSGIRSPPRASIAAKVNNRLGVRLP